MSESEPLKVLVVDDEATSRLLISSILSRQGIGVVTAKNGEEAVAVFEREAPHAVVMDVEMPVMDGYEATREIKRLAGESFVPVIFLTALADETALARCIQCGGDDFLSKPVSRVILEAKIHGLLRIRALTGTVIEQRDELRLYQIRNEEDQRIAEQVFAKLVKSDIGASRNVKQLVSPMSVLNGDLLLVTRTPGGDVRVLLGDFTGQASRRRSERHWYARSSTG